MATEFSKMSDQQLETWIRNHSEDNRGAPEFWYVEDVDNALTLPLVDPYKGYSINYAPGALAIVELYPTMTAQKHFYATKDYSSLARAICECWAAMREAEDDNGEA